MTGGGSLGTGARACAALVACVLVACVLRPSVDPDAEHGLEHWQQLTTRIRGRVFLEPVRLQIITPEQIPEISRGELNDRYDDAYIAAYRDAYSALGLFPPDLDLLEEMLALQGEQLVGLYSPSRSTLYVVSEPGDIAGGSPAIFVHELVHALQDQHFPVTMSLLQWLEHNDDVASAISAAVEGDASFSMMGIPFGEDLSRTSVSAERMREAMLNELAEPAGVLGEVPRFLRVSLIFPYAYGVTLAQAQWKEAGNDGLDDLVREPPLSSLRVMYPDDADPVEFVRLPREPLSDLLGRRGCELRHHNVAGAASTRVLFEDYGAGEDLEPLIRAWSGDRFQHAVCNGPLGADLADPLGHASRRSGVRRALPEHRGGDR